MFCQKRELTASKNLGIQATRLGYDIQELKRERLILDRERLPRKETEESTAEQALRAASS